MLHGTQGMRDQGRVGKTLPFLGLSGGLAASEHSVWKAVHTLSLPTQGRNPVRTFLLPPADGARTCAQAPKEWQDAISGGRLYLNAIHLFWVWEKPPVASFAGKHGLCGCSSGHWGGGLAQSRLPPEVCLLSGMAAASVGE